MFIHTHFQLACSLLVSIYAQHSRSFHTGDSLQIKINIGEKEIETTIKPKEKCLGYILGLMSRRGGGGGGAGGGGGGGDVGPCG